MGQRRVLRLKELFRQLHDGAGVCSAYSICRIRPFTKCVPSAAAESIDVQYPTLVGSVPATKCYRNCFDGVSCALT